MKKIATVAQDVEKPVEKPVLAEAIVEMSAAMKRLQKSGLNFEAIVILTQHNCKPLKRGYASVKPSTTEVRLVLNSLSSLESAYTSKK